MQRAVSCRGAGEDGAASDAAGPAAAVAREAGAGDEGSAAGKCAYTICPFAKPSCAIVLPSGSGAEVSCRQGGEKMRRKEAGGRT